MKKLSLNVGEEIIYEGTANRMSDTKSTGGMQYLTNHSLAFRQHKLNIGNGNVDVWIKGVVDISKGSNLLIISNAFRVKIHHGIDYKFTVFKRNIWIDNIDQIINS